MCARPQMMSMLPGFNSEMMPQGNDKNQQMMLRRYITIIESMTDKEMDTLNLKMLSEPSRITRLARGSGSTPQQVRQAAGARVWMACARPAGHLVQRQVCGVEGRDMLCPRPSPRCTCCSSRTRTTPSTPRR